MQPIDYDERMPTVTEQLRQALKACGRTMYEVEELTGVSRSVLSRFLSGDTSIGGDNLDKLATFLDLELRPIEKVSDSDSRRRDRTGARKAGA
jgi:transcriptional regulator with XRE-family HTH domain